MDQVTDFIVGGDCLCGELFCGLTEQLFGIHLGAHAEVGFTNGLADALINGFELDKGAVDGHGFGSGHGKDLLEV